MKRKLYSLVIATVIICLSGVLSGSAFAAEVPELRAAYKIDGTVTVNFEKGSTDYVLAAFYNADGQMLRCVTATDGVSIIPPEDAAYFKTFLLDRESTPRLPAAELSIPANHCTVCTEEELQQGMSSESFLGAIIGSDLTLAQATIPTGKTLTVPEGTTLTVSEELNVFGTLVNMGTIRNFGFIDVLGGALSNFGAIEGSWNEEGYYDSSFGIENGAVIENNGEIQDAVSVADYYRGGDDNSICEISGELEITDGYIAVAFSTEQIQLCLESELGYDIVMPCGADAANLNILELGGITVPEGKTLLLKDSVFDGEHSYQNSYQISEGKTLELKTGSTMICLEGAALQNFGTLNVCGSLINNGTIGNFGFIDILGGELINGGSIEGSWNEEGYYNSGLGIEGGAYVENNGEIRDGVSVGDYYRGGDDNSICEISGELEITDGYIAVAFSTEQIQLCLESELSYDIVMPCGADAENLNILELGGIAVPEGKTLLLKDSVFDGEHSYQNSYQISEGKTLELKTGSTMICLEGAALQNFGTLNVLGTLVNMGTIRNFGFIDVLGGTLSNFGAIEGSWNEEGYYDSSFGIENGAVIENNGEIHDAVSVADYYRGGDGNSICEISGELEITDGYIAVAFGTEQIQPCLESELSYDIVMPCGADAENLNILELGGITVPEDKTLLLKDSIFDGEHSYQNSYQISEGSTLTLSANSALICVGNSSIVINGSINDQGGYVQFGDFEVIGTT